MPREELVMITNEEMLSAASGFKEGLDVIDAELRDVRARLSRLYDAMETGKIDLDDISPRIKGLKARQEELEKNRVKMETEIATKGIEQMDVALVQKRARDLRQLLIESNLTERKAFLRSFVKRIETDGKSVTVRYKLPLVAGPSGWDDVSVLPIDNLGGPGGIRTPYLLTASQTFSQLNYRPPYCMNPYYPADSYIIYHKSSIFRKVLPAAPIYTVCLHPFTFCLCFVYYHGATIIELSQ